ncbi:M20 family metallopeptidase [Pectobacterium versatile]|uniref:Peptidase M20 domain-containing protein 2 n=1 Tax=Pectobacterium versatile TaxID=2488639 RepID=A0ABU8JXC4_9GAMM|nr:MULTISPECIES: M20 family metallopeptidase [Pectobacterium]AZK63569.1 M20 family peptidase [Pectobacterium versatile]MBA0162038.1 M20 family metallopeptidase [Pectobacterium versatile]MBD0845124.1 amidohydrolase [Pectobacterium carotovorum subsp. carotovorum]MBK4826879.1 Peptidase M20 domain-containing protein [Pectobacterium carotovorum subsp. carotovorum]MBN3239658.1 M20 family metallopeptidase [Pectobacterium versatile]
MSELTPHHRGIIRSHVEQAAQRYLQVSHQIHARPELGNQEYFAAETLTDLLRDAGFTVTRDIAGHETGFVARKGQANSGPRIGYLAEYDALPGLGHACGHNLIGTSSVAAAIALSHVVDQTGGEVWVFGTPAEEGGANGSAKGSFADAGVFDGIDAAFMIHGSGKTQLTSASLAVDPLDFHFTGRAAHASASPEEGINALDAVIQLFTGINALRQQLPGDTRIHGIITHGGEAPNIIPEYAAARFYIRASTWQRAQAVSERVRAVAEGAALATGSTLNVERFQNPVKDLIINRPLDTIVGEELVALGEGLSDQPRRGLGSTDAGNASHVIPVSHCYIKIGPDDLIGHTPEFREAAVSPQGDRALLVAAQALALSGYRLLTDPSLLENVKADFLRTHSPA